MKPWEVIQKLESDNSRLFKESVVKEQAEAKNTEFFRGCKAALDKLRTFGLKQVPESTTDGAGIMPDVFWHTLELLEKRELTGNEARDRVQDLCNKSDTEQWNSWYRRILIKDLRCGVTEKTINKHAKGYKIPVFDCMLADDSKKHEKKMTGEVLVEPKFDGVRVLAVCDVDKDEITLYSRNGKELTNFPLIKLNLDTVILEQLEQSMVLDGEVMSDDFQTLMREIHRKDGAKTDDAVLNLFDIVPLADFVQGKSKLTLLQRKEMLEGLKLPVNVKTVEYVQMNLSDEDGQKQFADYNKLCIDRGYEGIMIKPTNGIYECKRSSLWLKVKPFIEVSLKVIAVEEGTGRNVGKLGALIVEGTDMDKFIRTNVGSGLTDENREEFWKAKDKLIGQIVEVRADAITQNQEADGEYSLRFPRFLRFRGFEIGEKL
jgi:DNA ligase-1